MDSKIIDVKNPVYQRRLRMHKMGIALSSLAMAIGVFFLMWILFTLLIKGFSALSPSLFIETTPAPGSDGGGLMNAIVGSLLMVGSATLISTPIGILAGIYLAEYGKRGWVGPTTRFGADLVFVTGAFVQWSPVGEGP